MSDTLLGLGCVNQDTQADLTELVDDVVRCLLQDKLPVCAVPGPPISTPLSEFCGAARRRLISKCAGEVTISGSSEQQRCLLDAVASILHVAKVEEVVKRLAQSNRPMPYVIQQAGAKGGMDEEEEDEAGSIMVITVQAPRLLGAAQTDVTSRTFVSSLCTSIA